MKEIYWGQAKVEVIALAEEIRERLGQGYSIRRIWSELRETGKLTVTLRPFDHQVKRQLGYDPKARIKLSPSANLPAIKNKPLITPGTSASGDDTRFGRFAHDPTLSGDFELHLDTGEPTSNGSTEHEG